MADEKQNVRDQLYLAVKEAQAEKVKKIEDVFGSRQEVKEQIFSSDTLLSNNLLVPPYDPDKMYSVAESSGILPQCIDAMVQNIDGFGYEFKYTGDTEEEDSKEALNELTNLKAFFDMVNEEASFRVVRLSLRRDIETTGNGYLEVIRFLDGDIATIYHMDARLVRLQAKQEVPYKYNVDLFRNGKVRSVPISKRFRKFAMRVSKSEQRNLRWFKEFGDPRKMCAVSGKYEDDLGPNEKIIEEASEVIHFKIGHGTYGVPRWSGQVTNVLGMTSADYVNWDLFENQVVPPLVVMVSGGTLTAESIRDIQRILIQKRGIENFNKVLILEAQSEGNITDKSSTKIELKEMSVSRKEDAMFAMYVEKGEQRVRSSFRISPMLAGRAEVYCCSTKTRVLTRAGWKYHWEVETNEEIGTLNPENHKLEFLVPEEKYIFNYKGDLCKFKSTRMDIEVTPNHEMYIKTHLRKLEWEKMRADEVGSRSQFVLKVAPSDCEGEELKTFPLPLIKRGMHPYGCEGHYRHIDGDDFITLIGFYVADGSLYSGEKQGYLIRLCAKKERKIKIFSEIREKFSNYEGFICSQVNFSSGYVSADIRDKGLIEYVIETCGSRSKDKKLPVEFLNLNKRQSLLLLSCLISTDGSPQKGQTHTGIGSVPQSCRYATTSLQLAEQVQIIALRCGFRAKVNPEPYFVQGEERETYIVSIAQTDTLLADRRSFSFSMEPYDGDVFCYSVPPNRLFFTELNGCVSVTGNSRSSADAAKMTAEEQIFIPERATFDEIINIAIIPNIGGKYWKFQSKGPRLITGKEIVEGFKEFSKEGIFTINEGIRLANRLLNMDITLYKETWADYPIPFILELIKQGKLTELDDIKDSADTIIEKINRNNLTPEEKISIDDVFNNLENLTEEIKVRRSDKA